jgi:hypothetical protein
MMLGELHDKNALFMSITHGKATDDSGVVYDLLTSFGNATPMVRSSKTGNTMTFKWQTFIDYAIEHGINDEVPS